MKTKIILHGKLSKLYGKEFTFSNIRKPMDVLDALQTRIPGIKKYIVKESKQGTHYELLVNNEAQNMSDFATMKKIETVDIVPCIYGQLELIILGLLGLGYAATLSGFAAIFVAVLSIGLIIAGIVYLLTTIPEEEPNQNITAQIKNSSFLFQTPQNVTSQGSPVPITYGRLRVGSYVVGTTLSSFDLSNDQQNRSYESYRTEALLKIQAAFGSSTSRYIRGY